jgi:flavin-dependent dehydrogenase
MRCQNQLGETLLEQPLPVEYGGYPSLYCNRGLVQRIMYDHAVSLGAEITFGTRITRVFDNAQEAGVYVGDQKVVADAVVVADGVHSKGRAYVTGVVDKPKASGFAVYRSWFPLKALGGDPLLEEFVSSKKSIFRVWIGANTHGIVLTNPKMQTCVCFCTHKVRFSCSIESRRMES